MNDKKKVIVIGGGAAGMMAAITAAKAGARVILLEKNEKPGKKLYITGKGRCNVTNACERQEFFDSVMTNSKFMYSAFSAFDNYALMELLESLGCRLDIQRGNRVFPRTEKASDVIRAFTGELERLKVELCLNTEVKEPAIKNSVCTGVKKPDIAADAVIIATGGLSYQSTGSTGDGLQWAKELGLDLSPCRPSLVPIRTQEAFIKELQGLSLKNVSLRIQDKNNKQLFFEQGELLFTHFGISGPLVLKASAYVGARLYANEELTAFIDLKPALTDAQLDNRILRDFKESINKRFSNALGGLLPKKLIPVVIKLSDIAQDTVVNEITAEQRKNLIRIFKNFRLTLIGLCGYNEAVITCGGIKVKELYPKTMESRKIKGLYFAGEIIDIDALTGGFNLQLAFSTGYAAGIAAAGKE